MTRIAILCMSLALLIGSASAQERPDQHMHGGPMMGHGGPMMGGRPAPDLEILRGSQGREVGWQTPSTATGRRSSAPTSS